MAAAFQSAQELREVMDRVFTMMSEDAEMGPRLRAADVPQRFEFDDLDMVVNVRAGRPGEGDNLVWRWSDDVDWQARVLMSMSSGTANRYFQGKENVVTALARRRIRARGDVKAALALMPIVKPIHARFRDVVAAEYPHLLV
jgi:hypothetical protein